MIMKGLQTARVAVIDDEFTEAEPLLRGLSRIGVGALYFDGLTEMPANPLTGLRLVFLDLHLIAVGDAHSTLNNTVGVLAEIVAGTKGEVGIICWTKHQEEQQQFQSLLAERFAQFQPAFLLSIAKKDFFGESKNHLAQIKAHVDALLKSIPASPAAGSPGADEISKLIKSITGFDTAITETLRKAEEARTPFEVAALTTRIEATLSDKTGSRLIWDWEQSVHDAATKTTSLVHTISMAEGAAHVTDNNVVSLLSSLVLAAGGESVQDAAGSAASLFEGLNPIHSDFLEQFAIDPPPTGQHYEMLLKAVLSSPRLEVGRRAQINTAILSARISSGKWQPGNLYLPMTGTDPQGCPHKLCGIDKAQLGWGLLQPKYEKDYNELKQSVRSNAALQWPPEKLREAKQRLAETEQSALATLLDQCLVGLLEITPACDFSNKEFAPARLIGCLLVPHLIEDKIVKGDFIRRIKPITMPERTGTWHILLNSRFIFGVTTPRTRILARPAVRIRLPLLIDLQAWFASQAARPGHMAV